MHLSEPALLMCFLLFAYTLAPRMTSGFLLNGQRAYVRAHGLALLLVLLGVILDHPLLALSWPVFCGLGLLMFLYQEGTRTFSPLGLAAAIPFVFSLVSALWFFAGVNDLGLLGYGVNWSLYAALHGSYLGWLFVGCLVQLAKHDRRHLVSCWATFLLFLLVALGIDGVPYVKRIGVLGLALLVPLCIGSFAFSRHPRQRRARTLSLMIFASISLAMGLAVINEYWPEAPRMLEGLPVMVVIHGGLNALVTIPAFYLAILLEQGKRLDTLQ